LLIFEPKNIILQGNPKTPLSRTIEKAGYMLLALCLIIMGASGFVQTDTPANVNSLHVPFAPQLASNWCWAATTSMVLRYESRTNPNVKPLSQCQYVKSFYRSQDAYVEELWRLDSLPLSKTALYYFNGPGDPFVYPVGHTYLKKYSPLSYEELQAECAAGRPVIFGWQWRGLLQKTKGEIGQHFLVAEGTPRSSYFNGEWGWVSIHDPMPVNRGRHRIIRYADYANKSPMPNPDDIMYAYSKHYSDTYNITFVGK
jgi:hypothetical protein